MKILRFVTVASALLISVVFCAAQEKKLTKDEFYASFRAAFEKTRTLNRRNISKTQRFTDGKQSSTEEWQYEYDGSDKTHYIHITSGDGRTTRTEEIDIGQTSYCKENDGPWELSKGCIGGSAGGSPAGDTTYSLQTTKLGNKDVSLLREYTVYKDNYSKNKATEGLSFREWKLWIDDSGLVIREELTMGLVDPKSIKSSTIETLEYDPNIKVEAPVQPGGGIGNGTSTGQGTGTGVQPAGSGSLPTMESVKMKVLSKPAARNTEQACVAGFSGNVTLRVTFLSTGKIGTISVAKGAPYGVNEAAIEAAKNLKFQPAMVNGVPVTVTKLVEYHFECTSH